MSKEKLFMLFFVIKQIFSQICQAVLLLDANTILNGMGSANETNISQGFNVHGKLKFHRKVNKNTRKKLYRTKKMEMSITQMVYEVVE